MRLSRSYRLTVLMALASLVFYYIFSYELDRADFIKLISLFAGLFFLFIKMVHSAGKDIRVLTGLAILFRLVLFFSMPNLSQDFYRFIWDGRLILEGINPYLLTPLELMSEGLVNSEQSAELINGMGSLSASNHSNYPPLNQLLFTIAAFIGGSSIPVTVIVMRILIILADIGVILIGMQLLEKLKKPGHLIFWYALNPFIIIELTGNLHFEGVMLFFLIGSFYFLMHKKWIYSALFFAASISIKLIPLMLLPLLFPYLKFKSSLKYYAAVLITVLLTFVPFYSKELISKFSDTVGLWFQKFEFNASFYYIAREIGYTFRGYNEIAIIGSYIPWVVIGIILMLTFLRDNSDLKKMIGGMVLALTAYFLLSTTVHPWYIATLLGLSVFTKYRFPLVWSAMVILSYSAYSNPDFKENYWLIGIEYLAVLTYFGFDILRSTSKQRDQSPRSESV